MDPVNTIHSILTPIVFDNLLILANCQCADFERVFTYVRECTILCGTVLYSCRMLDNTHGFLRIKNLGVLYVRIGPYNADHTRANYKK